MRSHGEKCAPSRVYARVQAGFESPPLLASFCIFASGIAASDDAALSRRLRIGLQVALGLLCAATLARGLIGFLLAVVIRYSRMLEGRRRPLVPVVAALIGVAISVGRLHVVPASPTKSS